MKRVSLLITLSFVAMVATSDGDWWRTALVYQIYPRSFKDSDGDGIGDLNGITSKLGYLRDTGVDAIWLSPIYKSPMYDFGYDITDYRAIAPEFGTMDDFDNLMTEAKTLDRGHLVPEPKVRPMNKRSGGFFITARGIKVILDYVPNHTGNESEWFVKSCKREKGYDNYYVWADGKPNPDDPEQPLPPNNWISVFRKSAWEYNEDRGQFYLHQFVIGQPDLNYREPKVQEEMKEVLRFWLEKGVSGFRVDAVNMMYEVDPADFGGQYPDEPLSGDPNSGKDDYGYLNHIYTQNLDETYSVVYDWRDVLNEFTDRDGEYKLMMTEAYADLNLMLRYYGDGKRNGSIPFNFSFLEDVKNTSNAKDIKAVIDKWMTYMPADQPANWVNGNHDQSRVANRQGTDRIDAMNLLALILPGVALTYQGEELGMTDGYISWEDTVDPQACNTEDPVNYASHSRDPNRTPYHWNDGKNAGFSDTDGKTWLPIASDYKEVNLEAEMIARKSHYHTPTGRLGCPSLDYKEVNLEAEMMARKGHYNDFYKDVVALRKTDAVRTGDLETRALNENVLAVARLKAGSRAVVGVVNLSDEPQHVDLSSIRLLPSLLEVKASGVDSQLQKGQNVIKSRFTVSPHSAVALQSLRWVSNIIV